MDALGGIATNVLPLYGVILLAWGVGRHLPWAAKLFSTLLVYGLIPLLVLGKVDQADIAQIAVITPMTFVIAALMSLPARHLSRRVAGDIDPRLLSAAFSFFNVAFFGLPVAEALFGEAALSTMVCAYIGSALYGDTIGYYLIARGKVGRRQAATRALGVPMIHAFALALGLKFAAVPMPGIIGDIQPVLGTLVSVLGMAVIGLNLVGTTRDDVDPALMARVLAVRQAGAMLLFAVGLGIEALWIGVLEPRDRLLVGLIGLFPIAANITLFATLLDRNARQAAVLVGLSSLASLVLIAVVVGVGGASIEGL